MLRVVQRPKNVMAAPPLPPHPLTSAAASWSVLSLPVRSARAADTGLTPTKLWEYLIATAASFRTHALWHGDL
jgi:hypothetical protein